MARVDAFDGAGDVNELAGAQRPTAADIDQPRFTKYLTMRWLRYLVNGNLKAAGCKSAAKVDFLKDRLKLLLGVADGEDADLGAETEGATRQRIQAPCCGCQGSSRNGLHRTADSRPRGQGAGQEQGDAAEDKTLDGLAERTAVWVGISPSHPSRGTKVCLLASPGCASVSSRSGLPLRRVALRPAQV